MGYEYEKNRDKLHSSNGNRLSVSLFEEFTREDVLAKPVFKLSDWRKKYVELSDPTGYKAAYELLGDWEHWLFLVKAPAFAAELDKWNAEVEQKLRSEAIEQLRKQTKLPTGTAAAKVLAGIDGRKKKEEKTEPEKEHAGRVRDDAARLGIKRVK